jgi:hypothetical protein
MRRGRDGRAAFLIAPAPNPALDADCVRRRPRRARGLETVFKLDQLPAIQSSGGVGYQALAGDVKVRARPPTGCRYGGQELSCTAGKLTRKVSLRAESCPSPPPSLDERGRCERGVGGSEAERRACAQACTQATRPSASLAAR